MPFKNNKIIDIYSRKENVIQTTIYFLKVFSSFPLLHILRVSRRVLSQMNLNEFADVCCSKITMQCCNKQVYKFFKLFWSKNTLSNSSSWMWLQSHEFAFSQQKKENEEREELEDFLENLQKLSSSWFIISVSFNCLSDQHSYSVHQHIRQSKK